MANNVQANWNDVWIIYSSGEVSQWLTKTNFFFTRINPWTNTQNISSQCCKKNIGLVLWIQKCHFFGSGKCLVCNNPMLVVFLGGSWWSWILRVGELAQFLAFLGEAMGRSYDTCIAFNPPTHPFFHPIFLIISHLR
jgi:hypothetical protein